MPLGYIYSLEKVGKENITVEVQSKDGRKFSFIFLNTADRMEAQSFYNAVNLKTFYDDKSQVETTNLLNVTFARKYNEAVLIGGTKLSNAEKKAIQN